MQGLKGKMAALFARMQTNGGSLHWADLDVADRSRMQELINRGLVDERRTREGREYKRRTASTTEMRGGLG